MGYSSFALEKVIHCEKNIFRLFWSILISFLFISFIGLLLSVPLVQTLVLAIGSVFFELLVYFLTNRRDRECLSLEQSFIRYKQFLKKILLPTFLLAIVSIVFITIDSFSPFITLFYTHIFIVLFTVGYIICSNNIELAFLKKK